MLMRLNSLAQIWKQELQCAWTAKPVFHFIWFLCFFYTNAAASLCFSISPLLFFLFFPRFAVLACQHALLHARLCKRKPRFRNHRVPVCRILQPQSHFHVKTWNCVCFPSKVHGRHLWSLWEIHGPQKGGAGGVLVGFFSVKCRSQEEARHACVSASQAVGAFQDFFSERHGRKVRFLKILISPFF